MGIQKQKWTQEEEDALHAGVAKHGPGKWKNILRDPEFSSSLTHRSNIDLKDKWRNLSVGSSGQGPKDKSRTPRAKTSTNPFPAPGASPLGVAGTPPAISVGTPAATLPAPNAPNSASANPHTHDGSSQMITDDVSKSLTDANNASRYNEMVFEALSSIDNVNGSDIGAIVSFIEEKQEVPQNFRRLLGSRLRRLVQQGKLEKVENRYKLCNETNVAAKTPIMRPKDFKPKQSSGPSSTVLAEMLEDASMTAAYKVAEAENKSFMAAEAVKEAERIAKKAEDSEVMLIIAQEIYDRCIRGEVVVLN